MSKVTIRGTEYELRLDLNTMEHLEDMCDGDSAKAVGMLREKGFRNMRKLFVAMANSGMEYRKKKGNITEKALDHIGVQEITAITDAITAAEEEGYRADTIHGAADDDRHDAVLEAIEAEEEKNGETGEG